MITTRQRQAIILAGQGKKNREIAISMGITEYTVNAYMDRAFKKLNVHNRKDAAKKLRKEETQLCHYQG